MRVFVVALDSSGNIVLNPATYSQPVVLQLVYTSYGESDTVAGQDDVTLSVAYNSAVDPGGCGGTTTAQADYSTIYVCSPTDVITATYVSGLSNPAPSAVIIGSVAGSGDLTAPSGGPTPVATGYTGGVGALPFSINPLLGLEVTQYYSGSSYTINSIAANGSNTGLYQNTAYIYESGFTGNYTVGGTCGPYATLTLTQNDGYGDASLLIAPTTATTGCNITISDGTNTDTIPMTVTTTTVGGIQ
jgi:hypothetical protein